MRMFSVHFIHVWQRNRDVFVRLWRTEAVGYVVEPIIILLSLGMGLGIYVGVVDGQKYIEFLSPGIMASYSMFSASFECTYGSFIRMEYQNTYDAILATPLNVEDVIAGELFWGATRATLTGTGILIVATIFQLVQSPWAILIPAVCFLNGLLFAGIALLFTSLAPAIYTFNYFFTLFINPIFFLSGVFFPLDQFPPILQRLSWISPLTSVVHLTRALFTGKFTADLWLALLLVIVFSLLFGAISLMTMRRRIVK
jgi:lipooligosaccharide transport system permease protein